MLGTNYVIKYTIPRIVYCTCICYLLEYLQYYVINLDTISIESESNKLKNYHRVNSLYLEIIRGRGGGGCQGFITPNVVKKWPHLSSYVKVLVW